MIDKGLYKKGRVGLKGGADASTASFGASAGYSDPKTGSTGRADPKGGFNLGGGQGPTFDDAPATQVTGDQVRDARDAFIKSVRKTNPNYNPGGKVQYKKPTLGQFFSGLFSLLPGMGILRGLSGFNQRLRNTDFGRSKNLMDYLDMRQYGGYDEREMARRINLDEAKLLQDRIDAGEFDGLGTSLKRNPNDDYLGPNLNEGIFMDAQELDESGIGFKPRFGGTVLTDEFPSTEIDYGNPRNDPRVVPEEMGLVGDRGIMSVAEVLQKDIDASKARGFKMLDRDTAVSLGLISPNVTDYEFEQLKEGNITEPGTYTA